MMIERRLRTAKKMAIRQRNYQRARGRALTRLANAYPETYKELLEQEKVSDEQLYKKWVDIDGTTRADLDSDAESDTSGRQASEYHKEDEGNYGGEA